MTQSPSQWQTSNDELGFSRLDMIHAYWPTSKPLMPSNTEEPAANIRVLWLTNLGNPSDSQRMLQTVDELNYINSHQMILIHTQMMYCIANLLGIRSQNLQLLH